MTNAVQFQLGSVSTGTLRMENWRRPLSIANYHKVCRAIMDGEFPDDVIQMLNNQCPPFVYFGAHHENNADFGFWPDWDALYDAERRSSVDGQVVVAEEGLIVQFETDGQNVTVLDLDHRVLWTTV